MPRLPAPQTTKRAAAGSKAKATKKKRQSIDAYLEGVSDAQRAALELVRRAIRAAAPAAEECISYGLAAFPTGWQSARRLRRDRSRLRLFIR